VGQLVSGRYRVLDTIGTGGMGQVYLAEHVAIQKRVALKVLHPEYSSKHDIVERFRQEAISASRIKHPNVLEIFDYGELEDGSSFIAMELLEGRDLGQALEKDGPLPPGAAIEVLLQICRALEAAHARGVVHRDLKPDNVFLQKHGEGESIVKIVDFGIASLRSTDDAAQQQAASKRRLTRTGMIFGTPEYMAPEQAQGKQADQRSDVYAAGVILFETLTGAVPFNGDSFLEVLNRHVLFPIPRLADVNKDVQVSPELENVVRQAMAKDPAARFGSMREFAEALLSTPEAAAAGTGGTLGAWRGPGHAPRGVTQVRGTPLTATTTPEPTVDRAPARWALAGGTATVLIAAGVFAFFRFGGSDKTVAQVAVSPEVSPAAPATPADPAPAEPAPTAPAPEAAATPSADTAASAAPATPSAVVLSVTTTPPGAVLLKDGFQVCDATPCDVRAEPNETLVLSAQLGPRRGEAKVLAQRDQKISITLLQQPSKAPKKTTPAPAEGPKLCEVVVDGLKILRPCQ
jgi:serine/threonine-protein kinase